MYKQIVMNPEYLKGILDFLVSRKAETLVGFDDDRQEEIHLTRKDVKNKILNAFTKYHEVEMKDKKQIEKLELEINDGAIAFRDLTIEKNKVEAERDRLKEHLGDWEKHVDDTLIGMEWKQRAEKAEAQSATAKARQAILEGFVAFDKKVIDNLGGKLDKAEAALDKIATAYRGDSWGEDEWAAAMAIRKYIDEQKVAIVDKSRLFKKFDRDCNPTPCKCDSTLFYRDSEGNFICSNCEALES